MLDIANQIQPNLALYKVDQGVLFAVTGRRKEAEEMLKELLQYKNEFIKFSARLNIHAALDNLDEATVALEVSAQNHVWDWIILYNPLLAKLREDPRFADFCNKVGIPTRRAYA